MNAKRNAVGVVCGLAILSAVLIWLPALTGGPAPEAGAAEAPGDGCPTGTHDKTETPEEHAKHADEGHDEPAHKDEGHDEPAHKDEGHDEHDHAEDAPAHEAPGHPETEDEHAGHDPGDEQAVRLSAEEARRAGIQLATARPGAVNTEVRLPGEVAVNADRMAHIVPRAPGIVGKVNKTVGDAVAKDEVLAALQSAELGEAKVDYLVKFNELTCCDMDLVRAQAVHDNTAAFLKFLDTSPNLDQLRRQPPTEMGENRSKLVAAYAELVFTKAAYEREKQLFDQKVSSKGDFQTAESAYKKAFAGYIAVRDSTAFGIKRTLSKQQRARRNTEFAVKAAERKLLLYGLAAGNIEVLQNAARSTNPLVLQECKDPNCNDCKARASKGGGTDGHPLGDGLGVYALRAPFSGTIIEKHITLGEKLGDDANAFIIADLTTVWVNLSAYQKDLPYLRQGQDVVVSAGGKVPDAKAKIAFVAPIVDEKTRTALVRVVLPNTDGRWRPGLFVDATVVAGTFAVGVLVPKTAVQKVENRTVVFVPMAEGFEAKPIKVGRSSKTHVAVLSGLAAGDRYVAKGAFELKAKLVTTGLGAHAGHGH